MFYQMITNARDRWFASSECSAKGIIAYIEKANQMRDAQVDAIMFCCQLSDWDLCAGMGRISRNPGCKEAF